MVIANERASQLIKALHLPALTAAALLSGCINLTIPGLPASQIAQLHPVDNVDQLIVGNSAMFAYRTGEYPQWGALIPYPRVHAVYFGPNGKASYPHKPNATYTVSKTEFCFFTCFTVHELNGEYFIRDKNGHYEHILIEPGLGEISLRARRQNRASIAAVMRNVQLMSGFFAEMARLESLECVRRSDVFGCVEYSDGSTPFTR